MNIENSNIEEWKNTLEELKKEIKSNKEKHQLDEPLYKWLNTQQNNYISKRAIMKNTVIYDYWNQFTNECKQNMTDENYENYFYNQIFSWETQFIELQQFINTHKRFPVEENKDDSGVYYFFCMNQYGYLDNTLPVKKYDKWDTFIETHKEYMAATNIDNDSIYKRIYQTWEEIFSYLQQFVYTNKRIPNQCDENIHYWFITQNKSYKTKTHSMKSTPRYNKWTQFIEDYQQYFIEKYGKPHNEIKEFMSEEELWHTTFAELRQFIDTNRRAPGLITNNNEEIELCHWLILQSKRYTKGKITEKLSQTGLNGRNAYSKMVGAEKTIWSYFVKDYSEHIDKPTDVWDLSLEKLKQFIDTYKKLPWYREPGSSHRGLISHIYSTTSYTDEQSIYNFLCMECNKYLHKPEKCKKYGVWSQFLEEYKEYFTYDNHIINNSNQLVFLSDLSELKYYISHTLHNNTKTERESLIYDWWISSLLENPEFNNMYLDNYKEYMVYLLWDEKIALIKRFIDTNKKLPWYKNTDEKELYDLLYELNRIALFYNESKWKEFLLEYKQYFIRISDYWEYTFIRSIHKYLRWMSDFSELQHFIHKNNRLPEWDAADYEHSLHYFYNDNKYKKYQLFYIDNNVFYERFNSFIKTLL
uniref:Uncharacterized protein n=1 Tax=viral metagenome TaxID=1070528 RepID=A0A6C0JXS1_9ZZZZ